MTAYDTAKKMYESKGLDLDDEILAYSKYAYAYFSPTHLILAQLHETHWYVQIAVGKNALVFFLELMPKESYRPLVEFARGLRSKTVKHYNTEKLRKKYYAYQQN